MTIFTFANNVNTTLAGPVTTSATTITLASTANLPASIPAGEVLVITLNDVATRQNYEVLYATARTGATLTVMRAQEGTSALSWLTGDYAYSAPTAGQQASFGQLAESNTWTGANAFVDPVSVGAATAAPDAVNLGQFFASFGFSGYFEFPVIAAGVSRTAIVQWGATSITSSGTGLTGLNVTLPTPFPNAHSFCLANFGGTAPPPADSCAGFPLSTSQAEITIYTQNPGTYAVTFISIGY